MCVEKGMVSGHTQSYDSAPVMANAKHGYLVAKGLPEEDF